MGPGAEGEMLYVSLGPEEALGGRWGRKELKAIGTVQKKPKREAINDPKKEVYPGCSINVKEVNMVTWCEPGRVVGRKTRGRGKATTTS